MKWELITKSSEKNYYDMEITMFRQIYNELISFQYLAGIGKYSALLKHNVILKNSAGNVRRCFILATGPSIQTQDISFLQNEYCISVSNFFVHPLFNHIKPAFHVFAAWHRPLTHEQMGSWWEDATKHLTKNEHTKVLLNARDKIIKDKFQVFKNQQVYYYYGGGRFPVDFTTQLPEIQTVVHIAIYLAIYLGIKEIYLLGCDHSWLLHYGKSMHFYEEEQHAFTKNNYSEWSEVKDIGYDFRTYANLWDIYRKIRNETTRNNIKVFNATPKSLLDIFPKMELPQILNRQAKND